MKNVQFLPYLIPIDGSKYGLIPVGVDVNLAQSSFLGQGIVGLHLE